jgi:hypothetical protein
MEKTKVVDVTDWDNLKITPGGKFATKHIEDAEKYLESLAIPKQVAADTFRESMNRSDILIGIYTFQLSNGTIIESTTSRSGKAKHRIFNQ